MKNNKIPKWFKGPIEEGEFMVTNPYSGAMFILNGLELSMYLFIKKTEERIHTEGGVQTSLVRDMQRALTWFRKNNPDAYYVLLD